MQSGNSHGKLRRFREASRSVCYTFCMRKFRVEVEKSGVWMTVDWAREVSARRAAEVVADLASKGEHARAVPR